MAGPSVMVRVLGDLTGLGKSMDDTATKGAGAASHLHTAFSGVLDTLNQTGVLGPFSGVLDGLQSGLDKVAEHGKSIGPVLLGAGAAVTGVGVALQAMGSKDAAAHQQLQAAVAATGKSYKGYNDDVEAAIKAQEHFGNTAADTQDALRILTQATNDPAKAMDLLGTAADLAAAKHESLETAAGALGKAYNGNTKILKEFGVTVEKTGDTQKALTTATAAHEKAVLAQSVAQQNMTLAQAAYNAQPTLANYKALETAHAKLTAANITAYTATKNMTAAQAANQAAATKNEDAVNKLGAKLAGQASAQADTFSGRIKGLSTKLEDQVATLGQKYGPAITTAGAVMAGLGGAVEGVRSVMSAYQDVQAAVKTATEGTTAAQLLFNVALDANPIMIVVIAIIALVAIIIVCYAKVTWFRDAVNDMGRIAVAAFFAIVNAASAAFSWISQHWPLLLAILTGPFGLAVYEIVTHWNDLMSFFRGIPGQISGIASGMWDGILHAFRSMINSIIDLWNDLHFSTPSIDIFGKHIGGEEIGVPHIPHLAQGGLITADGLIYAHAGEAITPAKDVGRTAPAVHIEHAEFSTELDVEAFMKRAAWVAQTAGV